MCHGSTAAHDESSTCPSVLSNSPRIAYGATKIFLEGYRLQEKSALHVRRAGGNGSLTPIPP